MKIFFSIVEGLFRWDFFRGIEGSFSGEFFVHSMLRKSVSSGPGGFDIRMIDRLREGGTHWTSCRREREAGPSAFC